MKHVDLIRRGPAAALAIVLALAFWNVVRPAEALAQEEGRAEEAHEGESRFSDEPIPLAELPRRPRPILELGEPFLGTGTLAQGIRLPTGAVWQPALMVFGTLRMAGQGLNNGAADSKLAEAAGRFDLFGNLYLTPSERVVIGFRPLDQEGRFTRYTLYSDPDLEEDDFAHETNFKIGTLFFEGDFGELFPGFDRRDRGGLDIGMAVGRQPLSFQDGLLLNEDAIDLVGLTKANLKWFGAVNTRVTAAFAWGDIDRPTGFGNRDDKDALLFGLFSETDTPTKTIEFDVVYISADSTGGSGIYAGLGTTRRYGAWNSTFRVVASFPTGDEGLANRQGVLIFNQLGRTPHHSHNYIYVNTFVGIKQFRSAARGPSMGGPLGRTGVLFAAVGLGRFGAALGNTSDEAVGGALGYQIFSHSTRRQLILEAGGTFGYGDETSLSDALAGGARYQLAFGRRGILILDGFASYNLEISEVVAGGRLEILIKL